MRTEYRDVVVIEGDDRSAGAVNSAQRRIDGFNRTIDRLRNLTIRPAITILDRATAPVRAIFSQLNTLRRGFSIPISVVGGALGALRELGFAAMGLQTLFSAGAGLGGAIGVGINSSFEQTRATLLAMNKDVTATDKLLADLQTEAAATPFSFRDMATAAAQLSPALRGTNINMLDAIRLGERLSVLNPEQGFEGATMAIREALSGDWTSAIARFNLSRVAINKLKDQGVPAMEILDKVLGDMGVDASLVAAQGETLNGRWSTFLDTVDQFRMKLGAPLFDRMKSGLVTVQKFLEDNREAISNLASTVGEKLAGAWEWASSKALAFVGALRGFISGPIGAKILEVVYGLGDAVSAIFQAATSDPGALGVVGDLIEKAFGPEIAGSARTFLSVTMQVFRTIGRISETLGNLFSGRISPGEMLGALVGIFRTLGKTIAHEAGVLGGRIWTWITDTAIPAARAELDHLIDAVRGWVAGGGLDRLRRNLIDLAGGAWEWLREAGRKAGGFLDDHVIEPVKDWVRDGGPGKVAGALLALGTRAWEWISEAGGKAGGFLKDHLIAPIKGWVDAGGPGKVATALLNLGSRAWEWVSEAAGKAGAFLEGIVNAVITWATTGGPQKVADALLPLANQAWDWVKSAATNAPGQLAQLATSVQVWAQTEQGQAIIATGESLGIGFYKRFVAGFLGEATTEGIGALFVGFIERLKELKVPEDLQQSWKNIQETWAIIAGLLPNLNDGLGTKGLLGNLDPIRTAVGFLAAVVKAIAEDFSQWTANVLAVTRAIKEFISWVETNGVVAKLQTLSSIVTALQNPGAFVSGVVTGAGVAPHAEGGIFTKPHVGMVAEAGPEAIIPLDRLGSVAGGGGAAISLGEGAVNVTFTVPEVPTGQRARLFARKMAPEIAREIVRQARAQAPGLMTAGGMP